MIAIAHSSKADPRDAAQELARKLEGSNPELVLFFSTSKHDAAHLAVEMRRAFPAALTAGSTTAGEIISGHMLKGSVVAMGLSKGKNENLAVRVVPHHDPRAAAAAVEELAQEMGCSAAGLATDRYLGFVLHDGLSGQEEAVMEAISDRTNVPFVGGSAGDDLALETTYVMANGEARSGASVLILTQPHDGYRILKTQSFDVLDVELSVTKADEARRTVTEFNGKPAALAYADAVGCEVSALQDRFRDHPVGVIVDGDEPFVRSPQRIFGTDVLFYCQIREGMTLRLLRSRNIVEDTRRDLMAATRDLPVSGILNFHCILRTLELEQRGQTQAYADLFRPWPTVGFSTYGESYVGHMNQTSTMVLLS